MPPEPKRGVFVVTKADFVGSVSRSSASFGRMWSSRSILSPLQRPTTPPKRCGKRSLWASTIRLLPIHKGFRLQSRSLIWPSTPCGDWAFTGRKGQGVGMASPPRRLLFLSAVELPLARAGETALAQFPSVYYVRCLAPGLTSTEVTTGSKVICGAGHPNTARRRKATLLASCRADLEGGSQ